MDTHENKKGFWGFFITNSKFTLILLFSVIVFGLFSMISIPKESEPNIDIPVVVVTTAFPGANTQDVEQLVTNPIEDRLSTLDEVDEITSTSANGLSSVVVNFEVGTNSRDKVNDLKEKIDLVKNDLPSDALEPVVTKIRLSDTPILTFSLSGPFELPQLKQYSEDLKSAIERVAGVSEVQLRGAQDREVHVIALKHKLDLYGLNIQNLTQAISSANTDIPAGVVETADKNYVLNFQGKIESAEQIKNIPVTTINSVPVYVADIANVVDGFSLKTSANQFGVAGKNSEPALSIQVYKTSGGNILNIVDTIESRISEITQDFPQELTITKIEDNAKFIRQDLSNLVSNGFQTVIIVSILLLFFIGFREAILASLVIPLTYFLTFIILTALGFTLNFLTLFSLILALGILVDGAIVVTQGMHNNLQTGLSPKEAALKTVQEFQYPLISGTLTTIFAFVPMLMASGIMGEYIRAIPITVTIVLISSLIVALGFVTTLGGSVLKSAKETDEKTRAQKFIDSIKEKYLLIFKTLMNSKPKRRLFTFVIVILFFASVSLPALGFIKVEMFPQPDMDTIYINAELEPGTPLRLTENLLLDIENIIKDEPFIENYSLTAGSAAQAGSTSQTSSHVGNFVINLKTQRDKSSTQIVEELEDKLSVIQFATIELVQNSSGPGNSAPVEVSISGKSIPELNSIAQDIKGLVEQIEGTRNVNTTIEEPNPEFALTFDRSKAQIYGVTTSQVALLLRNAISGLEATSIKKDGDSIDVIVKYALDPESTDAQNTNKISPKTLEGLTIATPVGDIPLANFTKTTLSGSLQSIAHKDNERIVRVTSYTEEGTTAQDVFLALEDKLDTISIPNGYTIKMGGEREDIEQSYRDMLQAMVLGILLIAALLVLQFKSFRQPMYILATIPLSLIGVLPGLLIMNLPLTFPGIIGVVALAGIVVNNAIILIDRINQNREDGLSKEEAIIDSTQSRFEPIILTTITTILGILPLALQDETWGPLGYSIIFGLTFSTILTLIVVPLLYNRFSK